MRALLAVGLLAGCAAAAPDNGGITPVDAPGNPQDGPDIDDPPDSPTNPNPVEATLAQTTNTNVAAGNSVQCSQIETATGNIILTHANSWYRVYSLDEAGITGSFDVSKVTFAIELATNEPPVTVKVGTYAGTVNDSAPLSLAQANFLATTTVAITNTQTPISIDAPIAATIPANGQLIVEITSSEHTVDGEGMLFGTTNGPFAHTSYLMSATCSVNTPTAMANVCAGCGDSQAIIVVTGTH